MTGRLVRLAVRLHELTEYINAMKHADFAQKTAPSVAELVAMAKVSRDHEERKWAKIRGNGNGLE